MRLAARLALAGLAMVIISPKAADAQTGSAVASPELIRSLLPSVVNIVARTEATASTATGRAATGDSTVVQTGSGFVLDASGLIVTNYHVVTGANEIVITFGDGSHADAQLVSAARVADIALLKVKTETKLVPVTWADSDTAQIGDPVLAIGNPLGVGESVSAGIVSGLNRDIRVSPYDDFIQTDAAINHGNSGGALFNSSGRVIGINSAIISPTTGSVGLGFAIPSNDAQFVIGRLEKYGRVRPGWLGATMQQVTQHMAQALGMPLAEGSIVAEVRKDSPAARAGLQVGDLILRYAGAAMTDQRALLRAIERTPEGTAVPIIVRRDGRETALTATVEVWPGNPDDEVVPPVGIGQERHPDPPDLGLGLAELTPDSRAREKLDPGERGVLVTQVAARTAAAEARLMPGDVILRVQTLPVVMPADVLRGFAQTRAQQRGFVLVLVRPGRAQKPGARWVAVRLGEED
jgi:serine protease Do